MSSRHSWREEDRHAIDITIDRDEDGVSITECPALPGCVGQGRTKDEAIANVREAIRLYLEVRADRGLSSTLETRQLEIVGLSLKPQLHCRQQFEHLVAFERVQRCGTQVAEQPLQRTALKIA